jgi:hypothetical protein
MNINYRKCGCGVMLRPLEQCSACLSLRRAEAMAKAGPRSAPPPIVIRGWAPPEWQPMTTPVTWKQLELWSQQLPEPSLPTILKTVYPDYLSDILKVVYRG